MNHPFNNVSKSLEGGGYGLQLRNDRHGKTTVERYGDGYQWGIGRE